MSVTFHDQFCGAGGSTAGAIRAGAVPLIGMNHWQIACETYGTNHAVNGADVACCDVAVIDPRRFPPADILLTSPECFAAGTLILTNNGLVPIQDIQVGDFVLTHEQRWRRVERTQAGHQPISTLRGQGNSFGLAITANHRLWARGSVKNWVNEERARRRFYDSPDWTAASLLVDDDEGRAFYWSTPANIPPYTGFDFDRPSDYLGADEALNWWIIGRWVGDGSLSSRDSEVAISCGYHEEEELSEWLDKSDLTWRAHPKRTCLVFTTYSEGLSQFLEGHFGVGSANKGIPTSLLVADSTVRQAFLAGYISADGHIGPRTLEITTISKKLAIGTRLLVEGLGFRASLYRRRQHSRVIEGRKVSGQAVWTVRWDGGGSQREAWVDDSGLAWSRVKSFNPPDEEQPSQPVYNLEVEEDHSYVADGIVVANCTHHSYARGRPKNDPSLFDPEGDIAAERSRATMWDVPRFAEFHRYKAIIVENVEQAVRWGLPKGVKLKHGEYGPLFAVWLNAMSALKYEHKLVHLNAMVCGVPQSRDRLFVVFWRKGQRAPDLEIPALGWCFDCEKLVNGYQHWKKEGGTTGEYGPTRGQYFYRCPECKAAIALAVRPAAAAIDWALEAPLIGERSKPLAEATVERIQRGLAKARNRAPALVVTVGGNTYERRGYTRAWPVEEPFKTLTKTSDRALVVSNMNNNVPRSAAEEAMHAVTTGDRLYLLMPPPALIIRNGGNGTPKDADREAMQSQTTINSLYLLDTARKHATPKVADENPMPALAARGTHQALVIASYGSKGARAGKQGHARDAESEPLGTLTKWENKSLFTYRRGQDMSPLEDPMTSVTTRETHALVDHPEVSIDDCGFRMLQPHELKAGQDFEASYVLHGGKRDQVAQIGNAVPAAAEAELVARVIASLEPTGV